MRKYSFTAVILLSLLCFCFITPIHSALTQSLGTTIQSQGRVTYNGHYDLTLKYATDFEDVYEVDDHHISIPIEHYFQFDYNSYMWIKEEEGFGHSGSKCLAMRCPGGNARRAEFEIKDVQDLCGQEFYVSMWIYLPPETGYDYWRFGDVTQWYAINQMTMDHNPPNYHPYTELHLSRYNGPYEEPYEHDIELEGRDVGGGQHKPVTVYNFPVPLGEWFNLAYYVDRDTGTVKVWLNGQLVCDVTGEIWIKSDADFSTTPLKIYYNPSETSPHTIYGDDLEIYGIP